MSMADPNPSAMAAAYVEVGKIVEMYAYVFRYFSIL